MQPVFVALAVALALVVPAVPAQALTIFEGGPAGGGHDAARAAWVASGFVATGLQDWESLPLGTTAPLSVPFGITGGTLTGSGLVSNASACCYGAFSGTQHWFMTSAADGSVSWTLTFDIPVAGFAMSISEAGNVGGDITGTVFFNDASFMSLNPDETTYGGFAAAQFFGFNSGSNNVTSVSFTFAGADGDLIPLDDWRVGIAVPEPASGLLCGLGLLAMGALRRRRRA